MNDRIFVSTSSMESSVAVVWAAADNGITSRGDRPDWDGEQLIHMDGRATIKWWDADRPYVLVIDPQRRNGSYITIFASEDEPPDEDAHVLWKS